MPCTRTPRACCNDVFATNVYTNSQMGPRGPQGPTGATGPTGPSINLTIGTVTTGAPGTQASASITGTSPNFVLNLVIPQGPTGPSA